MITKNLSLAFTAAGIGCGTLLVHANFFGAYAQNTTEVCGVECVLKRIDALNQKVGALEHSVDGLTIEMENSIKSGRGITLHTDSKSSWRVLLTYTGPRGDLGGYVSWNVNCSRDTSWIINQTMPQTSKTDWH